MASFYLTPFGKPDKKYELHATTNINVGFSSTVTNYPIETGSSVSDNVVMNPASVSFTGVLTDVAQSKEISITNALNLIAKNNPEVPKKIEEYINDLRSLQFKKTVFTVYFSGNDDGKISEIQKAILTKFDISKDSSLGKSWAVDVTLQEVRFATPAKTVDAPKDDFKHLTAKNKEDLGGTAGVDASQTQRVEGASVYTDLNAKGESIDFGIISN
ncbi:MAG: hypothetical protein GY804_11825 [Alphaproteobacteria bacterium]|nr:hypothetical protein [Alphaproteobacteria bacterium]